MSELADPGQEFLDSDPTQLRPPGPAQFGPYPGPDPRARVAVEIGAAVLVATALVRHELAKQKPEVGQTTAQANDVWMRLAPKWMQLALPAIRHAYLLGDVDGLTPQELDMLAGSYVQAVGAYTGATSAAALTDGFEDQLARHWSADLAWHRATVAYGLDKQQMRGYVAALLRGEPTSNGPTQGIVPTAARLLVDKALQVRARRIGENEAASATQSGQRMSWLWLARNGRLDPASRVEWDDREGACSVCALLHRQHVALDEPFRLPSSQAVWAPAAHPGCRCELHLVRVIGKAYDPGEARDREGRWAKVGEKERSDVQDWIDRQKQRQDESPFTSPPPMGAKPLFGPKQGSPFGSPFAAAPASPFSGSPFAAPPDAKKAAADSPFNQPAKRRTIVVRRRGIWIAPPEPPAPTGEQVYYLPADDLRESEGMVNIGRQYGHLGVPGGAVVDFGAEQGKDKVLARADVSPWSMLSDEHVLRPERLPYDMPEGDQYTMWRDLDGVAHEAADAARDNVGNVVQRLGAADLGRIARTAGYEERESPDELRARVVRQVNDIDNAREDRSLAHAYIDYAVYADPRRIIGGSTGAIMQNQIESMEDAGFAMPSGTVPTEQVFAFEQGFQPGTHHDPYAAHLHGDYKIDYERYRSALVDFGPGDLPMMRFGLRESYMKPDD